MIGLHETHFVRECGHPDHVNSKNKKTIDEYKNGFCFLCFATEAKCICGHERKKHIPSGGIGYGACWACACNYFNEIESEFK